MGKSELKKDMTVFWEGDPSDCMYYIRWGRVGVYANYATSRQKKLAELGEGQYFGEMGLIDCAPRSATVVVLQNGTQLRRIGEEEFAQFLTDCPNVVNDIIQQLSGKLRQATKDYLSVCRSVSDAVGGDASAVDEASNYNFGQDEQLRTIHDAHVAKHTEA